MAPADRRFDLGNPSAHSPLRCFPIFWAGHRGFGGLILTILNTKNVTGLLGLVREMAVAFVRAHRLDD